MEAGNASMYDGATALAEAVIMAQAVHRKGSKFIVPESLNPLYLHVLKTYMKGLKIELVEARATRQGALDLDNVKELLDAEVFGVAVQTPNFFGVVEDVTAVAELKKSHAFVLVVCPNLLSLALLEAPGNLGAEICAGEAHYLAGGPSFGGPLLGFIAAKQQHLRQMPGRIVGKTVDKEGKPGFVLTAQTREQHIRREKATSNICSNEGLLALSAAITLSLLGKEGFLKMAGLNVSKTQYALSRIKKSKKASLPYSGPVFNEFVVELKEETLDSFFARAREKKILPGVRMDKLDKRFDGKMLVCVTEKKTKDDIDALVALFE
jgi:glycine dehydrogenase subunit 1